MHFRLSSFFILTSIVKTAAVAERQSYRLARKGLGFDPRQGRNCYLNKLYLVLREMVEKNPIASFCSKYSWDKAQISPQCTCYEGISSD